MCPFDLDRKSFLVVLVKVIRFQVSVFIEIPTSCRVKQRESGVSEGYKHPE